MHILFEGGQERYLSKRENAIFVVIIRAPESQELAAIPEEDL